MKNNICVIEKMDFCDVDAVFDVLFYVFHPDGIDDNEEPDQRFIGLWKLFLSIVGWDEDDYWEEVKARPCTCPECGGQMQIVDAPDKDKSN